MRRRGYVFLLGMIASAHLVGPPCIQAQPSTRAEGGRTLFTESFESGLDAWSFRLGRGHAVVTRLDGEGAAVELQVVDRPVYAIIEGSQGWGDVRLEGDVLFPTDEHNYLGFIYRYMDDGRRSDFGSLYIKGNGSDLQANLHSDTNVGRTLYPEVRAMLEGRRAITIGRWQHFALEVVGTDAHL